MVNGKAARDLEKTRLLVKHTVVKNRLWAFLTHAAIYPMKSMPVGPRLESMEEKLRLLLLNFGGW